MNIQTLYFTYTVYFLYYKCFYYRWLMNIHNMVFDQALYSLEVLINKLVRSDIKNNRVIHDGKCVIILFRDKISCGRTRSTIGLSRQSLRDLKSIYYSLRKFSINQSEHYSCNLGTMLIIIWRFCLSFLLIDMMNTCM